MIYCNHTQVLQEKGEKIIPVPPQSLQIEHHARIQQVCDSSLVDPTVDELSFLEVGTPLIRAKVKREEHQTYLSMCHNVRCVYRHDLILISFLHANAEASGATAPREPQIRGPLMLQYLVNILGGMGGAEPHGIPSFSSTEGGPNQGRWGDYVFSQEG